MSWRLLADLTENNPLSWEGCFDVPSMFDVVGAINIWPMVQVTVV